MATTLRKEALEIRLNSEDDARAAVQNFIPIQREAEKRGYSKIVFVIEQSLAKDIHNILGTFYRKVKTGYVYQQSPPTREFYAIPHYVGPVIKVSGTDEADGTNTGVPLHIAQEIPEPVPAKNKGGRPRKTSLPIQKAA